jgi:pilus assembly protein Flp/PilA
MKGVQQLDAAIPEASAVGGRFTHRHMRLGACADERGPSGHADSRLKLKSNREAKGKIMLETLKRLWQEEDAPTAVEYAVMVALIALAVIGGARLLGTNVNTTFNNAATNVPAS